MEIRIGENIKRLRKAKNVTQEQIAEVLGISVTAVSKWERGETYPDITLLFPLAHYFGVSLDELMGYDEERVQAEIAETLEYYRSLWLTEPTKAREVIVKAYGDYPNDYLVMHYYMWNLAGDMADNDKEALLAHKEEFLAICDKILNGCTEETVRLNAWNMRAKLLHAEEKTEEALTIYREKYPNWYDTRDQKTEQLFAKDTPEFGLHLKQNMYELACFATDKKMKEIWFCTECTFEEKGKKSLDLAEALADMRKRMGNEELLLQEYVVYDCLKGYLRRFGAEGADGNAILEKKKAVVDACNELAERDTSVRAYIVKRYGCEKLS
ncbi:MAG: helix-turn-helix transcriptional regulator [Lachnospiraceae bacterium]|nr:helix-turn-helix transcriptional regulator [Lachnospiraceae bacterium]